MTGAASASGAACRQSAFAHCSHIHRVSAVQLAERRNLEEADLGPCRNKDRAQSRIKCR